MCGCDFDNGTVFPDGVPIATDATWLDTTASPGNVTATSGIRAGRAALAPPSSTQFTISHPLITSRSIVTADIELATGARVFTTALPTTGAITIGTNLYTAIPIRWQIHQF